MSCGCMNRDSVTQRIVSLFEQGSKQTQRKMLAAMIAFTEGTDEERQILEEYIAGNKERIQLIYDHYLPKVIALEQKTATE